MQFDATIIPPGEYRFHGKVSLEVLLEQRIQNVPSSSKSSAPLVEVARKSGAREGTAIIVGTAAWNPQRSAQHRHELN